MVRPLAIGNLIILGLVNSFSWPPFWDTFGLLKSRGKTGLLSCKFFAIVSFDWSVVIIYHFL